MRSTGSMSERSGLSSQHESSRELLNEQKLEVFSDRLNSFIRENSVDLGDEELSNSDIWALCILLNNSDFENVKSLDLSSTDLTDEAVSMYIAPFLENNKTITDLNLSGNNITQMAICDLKEALIVNNDNTLQKLNLEDNVKINAEENGFVGEILESKLISLNLSGIVLQREMEAFARKLKQNEVLEELILENVHLDEESAEVLVSTLCEADNRSQLQTLVLDFNPVSEFNVFAPFFCHPNFHSLKRLSLSFVVDGHSLEGSKSLVQMIINNIRNNRTLEELILSKNNLKNQDCKDLANLIEMPTRLKLLDLSDNNINIAGIRTLRTALVKNLHLREFILHGNSFLEDDGKEGTRIAANIVEIMDFRKRQESICTSKSKIKISLKTVYKESTRKNDEKNSTNIGFRKMARTNFDDNEIFSVYSDEDSVIFHADKDTSRSIKSQRKERRETKRLSLKTLGKESTRIKRRNFTNKTGVMNIIRPNLKEDETVDFVLLEVSDEDEDSVIFDDGDDVFELGRVRQGDLSSHVNSDDNDSSSGDVENDYFSRTTHPGHPDWALETIQKSELSFLTHMRRKINQNDDLREGYNGIIQLSTTELDMLEEMLSEFQNLLDRRENINVTEKKHRSFFGVIGNLKVINAEQNMTISQCVIDRTIISRQLARNVAVFDMLENCRREIGSDGTSELGGMLPSTLIKKLLHQPEAPSVDMLESFSDSFLLIRVVVWSILKAFALSKPEVDPGGRHLLEEFGRAKFKQDNSDDPEDQMKFKLGQNILEGALFELIDVIILLKPMYSFCEVLFMISKTTTDAQPSLCEYEYFDRIEETKAARRIERRMKRVNNVNRLKEVLLQVKKNKPRTVRNSSRIKSDGSGNGKQVLNGLLTKISSRRAQSPRATTTSKQVPKKNKSKRGIRITEKMLQYREYCPERIAAIISDLKEESKCLSTILRVQAFLPTLLSLCDYSRVCTHIQERCEDLSNKWPIWINNLSADFQNQTMEHVREDIISTVKPYLKFNTNIMVKRNEFKEVFARIKNQQQSEEPPTIVVNTSTSAQSFYHPLINQIFSMTEMSEGATKKVKEVVAENVSDENSWKRSRCIELLKMRTASGCEETVAMKVVKATEDAMKMFY